MKLKSCAPDILTAAIPAENRVTASHPAQQRDGMRTIGLNITQGPPNILGSELGYLKLVAQQRNISYALPLYSADPINKVQHGALRSSEFRIAQINIDKFVRGECLPIKSRA